MSYAKPVPEQRYTIYVLNKSDQTPTKLAEAQETHQSTASRD